MQIPRMIRQATKAARQGSAVKIILERTQRDCLRMQSTGAAAAVRGGGGQRGSGGAEPSSHRLPALLSLSGIISLTRLMVLSDACMLDGGLRLLRERVYSV